MARKKVKDNQEQPIKATKSKRNLIKESGEEESKTNEQTEKQPQ